MISARQIRAARALIGLSQPELAERAGVGVATIRRIEAALDQITGNARTLDRIQSALEAAGVHFIESHGTLGEGVRLDKSPALPSTKRR